MNLQRIKIIADRRKYEFKSLAKAIGMSEGNLHRCVRENKIQAQDLEKIAVELHVSIKEFFDENDSSVHTEGANSPASGSGDVSNVVGDPILLERINALEDKVKDRDERLRDKDELISQLKERIEELKRK